MTRSARRAAHPSRSFSGQTLVLFALLFTVLLGALGLAIDGGYLYVQRRGMQNAADAAALAGAYAIGRNQTDTQVTQIVLDAAVRNGVSDASNVTCTFITNAYDPITGTVGTTQPCSSGGVLMSSFAANYTGVLVRTAEQHQTFVFRAIGTPQSGTAATAAARVQRPIGITGGPFMVCGVNTKPDASSTSSYTGGIYQLGPNYAGSYSANGRYTRDDGRDSCQNGPCATVPNLAGEPVVNTSAYAYANGNRDPITTTVIVNNVPTTVPVVGPVYLVHDPNGNSGGINPCNDSSSSFKGVNTSVTTYRSPWYPAYNDPASSIPAITTGNVTSVQATVNGLNGCQAGGALNNCIMILPITDASGPGGTGSNAVLAVRSLRAFYIKESANGSHTAELIKDYDIQGNSDSTYVTGSNTVKVIKLIK